MRAGALLAFTLMCVGAAQAPAVVLENAWIMTPPPAAREAAAFVSVRAAQDDRLLSVACACAARGEMHEMNMDGATMMMRPLRYGAPVSASVPLRMGPHGVHVMLVGLNAPLLEGQSVPLRLTFRDAGIITVTASVRRH
jgi:periplasmic copper chaperone A